MEIEPMRNAESLGSIVSMRIERTSFRNQSLANQQRLARHSRITWDSQSAIRIRKKGFFHGLEGTIAALILMFYTFQLFQTMNVDRIDWTDASSKQENGEFLLAAKNSEYSDVMFRGHLDSYIAAARYFLGESRGYSVRIDGLPKQFFDVGVATNDTAVVAADINTTSCIVQTDFSCYNSTFKGVKYVLTDYDSGGPDGREWYNALYFDFNGDGFFSGAEGPFWAGGIVYFGSAPWLIGKIHNSSGNVSFMDAAKLVDLRKRISNFSANGRETNFSVRGASLAVGISEFDAVVIPGGVNAAPYESELAEFLKGGGGVVELKNITAAGNINSVDRNIFGLSWINYGTFGTRQNATLSGAPPGSGSYLAGKYFQSVGVPVNTSSTSTTGYVTDNIPNNDTAHIGNVTLRRQTYAVLVTKSAGSPSYDTVRIDFNPPLNNFTDEIPRSAGQSVAINGNDYTVKSVSSGGMQAVLSPGELHVFADFLQPATSVYPRTNDSKYVFAQSGSAAYNITSRSIGASVVTIPAVCAGTPTMPPGEHKCGSFSAGADYDYAITKRGASYTLVNVDFNSNGMYNDAGEGPFLTSSIVPFGPENYVVLIVPTGDTVTWVLESRWPVPYAIINDAGIAAAVWMPDSLASGDEWSLFGGAIVAASKKPVEIAGGYGFGRWASASAVFVENNDTYMPYKAKVTIWY